MPPVQGFQGAGPPPWYAGIGAGSNRLELAKRMLARLTAAQSPQMVARHRIKQPGWVPPALPSLDEIVAGIPAGYKPPQPGMSPSMRLINTSLGKQLFPGQGGQYWAYPPAAPAAAPPPPVAGPADYSNYHPFGPNLVFNPATGQWGPPQQTGNSTAY